MEALFLFPPETPRIKPYAFLLANAESYHCGILLQMKLLNFFRLKPWKHRPTKRSTSLECLAKQVISSFKLWESIDALLQLAHVHLHTCSHIIGMYYVLVKKCAESVLSHCPKAEIDSLQVSNFTHQGCMLDHGNCEKPEIG